jgi:hypothetical protein
MGELVDRLERLAVEARSPNGVITATVRGRYQVALEFLPGAYARHTDGELAYQLGQLAAIVWVRYRREYAETVEAFHDSEDLLIEEEPRDVAFQERLALLIVTGSSAQGWITVRSRALVRWDVSVGDGAVQTLTEDEFLGEADSVLADVLAGYQAQLIMLTDELYGIGVPDSLRRSPADRS